MKRQSMRVVLAIVVSVLCGPRIARALMDCGLFFELRCTGSVYSWNEEHQTMEETLIYEAVYFWRCWQVGSPFGNVPVPPAPSGGGGSWPTWVPNLAVDADVDGHIDCWETLVTTTDPQAYTLDAGDNLGSDHGGPADGVRNNHNGIDLQADSGDPILAAGHGFVVENSFSTLNGNYVRIRYLDGSEGMYLHMQSRSPLPVGSRVNVGAQVGQAGTTGSSTGVHLHYTLYDRPAGQPGRRILDPAARHGAC